MFADKTLIIVGAGASSEVDMPVGSNLAKRIAKLVSFKTNEFGDLRAGDQHFYKCLKKEACDNERFNSDHQRERFSQYKLAANHITNGVHLVDSIDNYIDTHKDNEYIAAVGKSAIVNEILRAETKSKLYPTNVDGKSKLNFEKLEDTWLMAFGRILVGGIDKNCLDRLFDNVTIICFNYDRCIETFLIHYLAAVYAIPSHNAAELVRKLNIIRPYGLVGPSLERVPFGSDPNNCSLWTLGTAIKTYTEQVQDDDLLREIQNSVHEAKNIIYLGFAYHDQNMRILTSVLETEWMGKQVFATSYGFSETDRMVIQRDIARQLKLRKSHTKNLDTMIRVVGLTCIGLFEEFKRTFAANAAKAA